MLIKQVILVLCDRRIIRLGVFIAINVVPSVELISRSIRERNTRENEPSPICARISRSLEMKRNIFNWCLRFLLFHSEYNTVMNSYLNSIFITPEAHVPLNSRCRRARAFVFERDDAISILEMSGK